MGGAAGIAAGGLLAGGGHLHVLRRQFPAHLCRPFDDPLRCGLGTAVVSGGSHLLRVVPVKNGKAKPLCDRPRGNRRGRRGSERGPTFHEFPGVGRDFAQQRGCL